MKTIIAIGIAIVYALIIRLVYGANSNMEVMSGAFLIFTPVIIGFLSVILIPKGGVKSAGSAFFIPWLTSIFILIITILLEIEGAICWIMIFPLFAIAVGIGGVIAYYIKFKNKPDENDWDFIEKNKKMNISIILALPLILGFLEGDRTLNVKQCMVTQSVEIAANKEVVWGRLTDTHKKLDGSDASFWTSAIGFPQHKSTVLDTLKIGGKRMSYYDRGLFFEERITDFAHAGKLVLAIKTDPGKIPPTVMDEHIIIGGKYIDLKEDIYTLESLSNGHTKLTLSSAYVINTPFNWYADIWASFLMKDILEAELRALQ